MVGKHAATFAHRHLVSSYSLCYFVVTNRSRSSAFVHQCAFHVHAILTCAECVDLCNICKCKYTIVKMCFLKYNCNFIIYLIELLKNEKPQRLLSLMFLNFIRLELKRLLRMRITLHCLPDAVFGLETYRYCEYSKHYLDPHSCAFGNLNKNKDSATWCYLCCLSSSKKFKVLIINLPSIPKGKLYISDTMKFNLHNALGITEFELCSYILCEYISFHVYYT